MEFDKNISLNSIYIEIKNNFFKLLSIVFTITFITLIYLLFFHPKLYKDSVVIVHHGSNFSSQSGFNLMSPLESLLVVLILQKHHLQKLSPMF